jgi:hypothetical protein
VVVVVHCRDLDVPGVFYAPDCATRDQGEGLEGFDLFGESGQDSRSAEVEDAFEFGEFATLEGRIGEVTAAGVFRLCAYPSGLGLGMDWWKMASTFCEILPVFVGFANCMR